MNPRTKGGAGEFERRRTAEPQRARERRDGDDMWSENDEGGEETKCANKWEENGIKEENVPDE